ncbi:MAG: zf-HC2 domain-containing protein [Acidobacteria bacterium]|nr:zf-HC2 domain-containing protein [Acidobacteriota bacterium]
MTCPDFDWKGFVLDELPAPERRRMEEHLQTCAACRQEVESLGLTVTALHRLPVREIPRRISFVSDPIFEPSWWQRFWSSAPRLGFASAAMLSLAIVVHAFAPRAASPAHVQTAQAVQVEQKVQAEVERRLPAAVDAVLEAKVQAKLTPAMAEFSGRLQEFEKKSRDQRNADLRDISTAFDVLQKKVNNVYLSAARYGGD